MTYNSQEHELAVQTIMAAGLKWGIENKKITRFQLSAVDLSKFSGINYVLLDPRKVQTEFFKLGWYFQVEIDNCIFLSKVSATLGYAKLTCNNLKVQFPNTFSDVEKALRSKNPKIHSIIAAELKQAGSSL